MSLSHAQLECGGPNHTILHYILQSQFHSPIPGSDLLLSGQNRLEGEWIELVALTNVELALKFHPVRVVRERECVCVCV